MGHDDDPEGQHRNEEQSDAGVVRKAAAALQDADHCAHDDGAHRTARYGWSAGNGGQRHPWQHSVTYGFTKEGHSSDDDPGPDDTADDRDESSPDQGPEEEVCGKRFS